MLFSPLSSFCIDSTNGIAVLTVNSPFILNKYTITLHDELYSRSTGNTTSQTLGKHGDSDCPQRKYTVMIMSYVHELLFTRALVADEEDEHP